MFTGRIDRIGFILGWIYTCVPMVAVIFLYAILNLLIGSAQNEFRSGINILLFIFGLVWLIAIVPVTIGLSIRRWHDMNESGWFYLFYFLPIVGNLVFFVQAIARGSGDESNRFGQKLSPRGFDRVIFGPHKEDLQTLAPVTSVSQSTTEFTQPPTNP